MRPKFKDYSNVITACQIKEFRDMPKCIETLYAIALFILRDPNQVGSWFKRCRFEGNVTAFDLMKTEEGYDHLFKILMEGIYGGYQ